MTQNRDLPLAISVIFASIGSSFLIWTVLDFLFDASVAMDRTGTRALIAIAFFAYAIWMEPK